MGAVRMVHTVQTMSSRSRPLLVSAVALTWLVLGPLAALYGSCVIMCDTCDIACPAAPGAAYAPRVDSMTIFVDAPLPTSEPHLTLALAPPAPPPKLLLSV
jgi:hypothetical protein